MCDSKKEARYYVSEAGGLRCLLCPHECLIPEDKTGRCLARKNLGGILYAESYGQVTGMALDPIEKKPLKLYYPGSYILSVGSYGCNMNCSFCQNHRISTGKVRSDYVSPENLAEYAIEAASGKSGHTDNKSAKAHSSTDNKSATAKNSTDENNSVLSRSNIGVAFTYNEPLINTEYILDVAPKLREQGLKTVLVTNGFAKLEVIEDLLPWVDATNIDLKAFDEKFYRAHGGSLMTVKNTIEKIARNGTHVEITTLIIPGSNDDPNKMKEQVNWIAGISPDIPLHLSRFFPNHHMTGIPPTPLETMKKLEYIAREKLEYVYLGNVGML